MAVTIKGIAGTPLSVPSEFPAPVLPFTQLTVDDTAALSTTETVIVTLGQSGYQTPLNGFGTLTDPVSGITSTGGVFSESGLLAGTPTFASDLLHRLVYTPPTLAAGTSYDVQASITVSNGGNTYTTPTPAIFDLVTAPQIQHTTPDQPLASGESIHPFGTVLITDADFDYRAVDTAVIKITDGGSGTDADGLLSGPGLSKTGPGTYTIASYTPWNLTSLLQGLSFKTVVLGAGQTASPKFQLDLTDDQAGLTKSDSTTGLRIIGPPVTPVPPSIAGTQADQSVAPGNVIVPFHAVTISDANPNALDTLILTVSDAGSPATATDSNGTFGSEPWLSHVAGSGVYTIASSSPATLTTELDQLVFTPSPLSPGQAALATNFKLQVTNTAGLGAGQSVTDSKTSLLETQNPPGVIPPQPPGSAGNNFLVHNETTGQVYQSPGSPYTGPVAGITSEIVFATTDNINVNAQAPNVFIHSGSGQDGLTVSSGNNILDGSTNSNFLVGGVGNDTFYLDDRNPDTPIFSTIVNFHSGDNATVFGVTQADFTLLVLDNQGAAGFTGVDLIFSATGHVDTSFVLAGFTKADLTNNRLTMSYGQTADQPGAPGASYMTLHAN